MPDNLEESLYPISHSRNGNGNGNGNIYKNGNGNGNGHSNYVYSVPSYIDANTISEEDEDNLDLRQLLSVVKHRIRLISWIVIGVTTASILWTLTREPKYRGNFQLLVEPVSKQKTENPLSLFGDNLSGLDYESQIGVLRSPSVMNPIIERLKTRYDDIEYEDLISIKRSPLKIDRIDDTKIINVSYTNPDREKIEFVLDNLASAYLNYSLEEKQAKVNQGIEFVDKELPGIRARVDELQEKLQLFRQKYNLLDPEQQGEILASKQVNFEKEYFNTRLKLKETKSLYQTLQKQLGKNPNEAIATSYLSESTRYQNLLNELQKIEVAIAQESARFVDSSPRIVSLKEKQRNLLNLLQKEATQVLGKELSQDIDYTASAPTPSSLRSGLDQEYIKAANEIEILEIRQKSLQKSLNDVEQSIEQMPVIARQYTDLHRQLKVATESLTRFLAAQEELKLNAAQQALPWQLIAQPTLKEDPVSPNHPRNIALGLIGGSILGLGAALLAERLDPVFHSAEEIKENVKLPMLGIIPIETGLKPLEPLEEVPRMTDRLLVPSLQIGNTPLSLTGKKSPVEKKLNSDTKYGASQFLEAFRSLNTNIKLLGSDSPINSIVISSSIPSEGKSTVSSHLAQAAAAMGQRVLLVDADLRRPQVDRWTRLSNDRGLSNILASNLSYESVIKEVPEWENLSVITAGNIPPDPTRLLASRKMQELMDELKQSGKFDLIIYDTPPVLGFADGRILGSRTNGVVLVVRLGKTDRSLLKQNIDNLRVSNVPVLGLIANQANRNSSGAYSYYSNYYDNKD